MSEVPDPGEYHCDAVIVRRLDDFGVPHRAAGLDHCCGPGFDRDKKAVGERKECVGSDH